uniref:Anaphase-promoting complex subunit 4-like WD40 domain-containing protein n=1 Tax=Panagrolaimus superbus TaxID=310955 RepID=A0A914YTB8_9BILA
MEIKCFIYLSKKLTVPFTRELRCVSWNQNRGFVCAGGVDGSVRLFKLHPDSDKNMNNPFYMNSALEGHGPNSNVEIAQWNEYYQKLTTSDDSGMIIVWSPNQHDNSWYEEMVNNRNKSTIMDMKWSPDGQKVSIVYEDGQVIVGSVEGNRIWAKDVSTGLAACAFNVDSSLLLVGLMDGEVHAYDSSGNFAFKVPMICIESMELETALATKDTKKDTIISMEYFVPPSFSKDPEPRGAGEGLSFGAEGFLPSVLKLDTFEKNHIARSPIPSSRPRLAIAFQNGVIQLMRNEMDSQPIIIRERNTVIRKCHWSPDGSVLAVGAKVNALNVLLLFSPTGEKYQALPMPDKNFNCFTWKGDGLAIGCGVDNSFFLATVRPRYKWAYCNHTVVYAYAPLDISENIVTFFETKMNEKHEKILPDVINIESHGEYCIIANLTTEISGPVSVFKRNYFEIPLK